MLAENLHRAGLEVFFDEWDSASRSDSRRSWPPRLARKWWQEEVSGAMAGTVAGSQRLVPVLLNEVGTPPFAAGRVPLPKNALQVDEGAVQTQRSKTPVAAGELAVTIRLSAPTGQKLDDRWGDPTQLKVSSTPPELLVSGGGTSVGLSRTRVLSPDVPEGVLHLTARAAACDGPEDANGDIPDHAACHLYQQDWGIPVLLAPDGATELALDLRGMDR